MISVKHRDQIKFLQALCFEELDFIILQEVEGVANYILT